MVLSKSNTICFAAILQAAFILGCTNLQTVHTFHIGSTQPTNHDQLRRGNTVLPRFRQPLFAAKRATGGRRPGQDDKISLSDEWEPTPCRPDEARLTVIQITDVYTLEHLASVKTLVEQTRAKSTGSKVVCMITGDFLSPYLLSSVDRGQGMMDALNRIPMVRIFYFYIYKTSVVLCLFVFSSNGEKSFFDV
jgi:hypothetical protein